MAGGDTESEGGCKKGGRSYKINIEEALGEYKSQKDKLEEKISIFGRKNDYLNLCQAIYQCLPDESNRASRGIRK